MTQNSVSEAMQMDRHNRSAIHALDDLAPACRPTKAQAITLQQPAGEAARALT